MKRIIYIVLLAMLMSIGAQAQIPDRVKEIMSKCGEKMNMNDPAGKQMDMKLHVGAVIGSMNGTISTAKKGDKSYTKLQMKALGHDMLHEEGYDGVETWEYEKAMKKEDRDTLTITKGQKKGKKKADKYSVDLGIEKEYKKAELKETDKFYVITFTKPIGKDTPRKTTVTVVKDTYMLHEFEAKVSIATMRMTVTKIKVGVGDSQFKLDSSKYPNAVVVRK